jgi:hypothetical protein
MRLFVRCGHFVTFCGVAGATWPRVRIVTTDTSREGRAVKGFDNQPFTMSCVGVLLQRARRVKTSFFPSRTWAGTKQRSRTVTWT